MCESWVSLSGLGLTTDDKLPLLSLVILYLLVLKPHVFEFISTAEPKIRLHLILGICH
jgi:hypothetical protein